MMGDGMEFDKRLSLLEQAVNSGFAQLRSDLQRVIAGMAEKDSQLEAKVDRLDALYLKMLRDYVKMETEHKLLIRIGSAIGLGVIGLIIERLAALL